MSYSTVENLQRKLDSPHELPTRSEIIDGLNQFEDDVQRANSYKKLFCHAGNVGIGKDIAVRYELVTHELVGSVATHLAQTAGPEDEPVRILELGAGDGKLAQHISSALETKRPGGFDVRAVDDGSWEEIPPLAIVERTEASEALASVQPDIVIMTWPPVDWTQLVRKQPSVREYLLIGDPSSCGVGRRDGYGAYGASLARGNEPRIDLEWDAPWIKDGFAHAELKDISAIQLGFNWRGEEGLSKTFSFRRTEYDQRPTI